MIGILIATHGQLGQALLDAAEFVLGHKLNSIMAVGVSSGESPDKLNLKLTKAVAEMDHGHGVLILTDMFGGSPADMSMSFLSPGKVDVVTGVNLPMLLQVVTKRMKIESIADLAEEAVTKGIDSISSAGQLLDS